MKKIPSSIFIDGGDPQETARAKELLGHIDGQTTNPSLIAKRFVSLQTVPHPDPLLGGEGIPKITEKEALEFYKKTVQEIAKSTSGPISIQVIADQTTKKDDMLSQAHVYKDWIPNGVVKFPATYEGLAAAEEFCQVWSVNITLTFSQEQAAAVYVATKNAKHRVFVSPFIGRLDDRGENGMQVVENIIKMYQGFSSATELPHPNPLLIKERGKVEVLTASVRKLEHILYALQLKSNEITIPFKVFQEWADKGFSQPDDTFHYDPGNLKPIPYREIPLNKDWRDYDLHHDLTDVGLKKFMEDWRSILK